MLAQITYTFLNRSNYIKINSIFIFCQTHWLFINKKHQLRIPSFLLFRVESYRISDGDAFAFPLNKYAPTHLTGTHSWHFFFSCVCCFWRNHSLSILLNIILNLKALFSQRLFPFACLYYSIEEKPFQELFENYFNCFYSAF